MRHSRELTLTGVMDLVALRGLLLDRDGRGRGR